MKTELKTLAILSTLALSACGGGAGGDSRPGNTAGYDGESTRCSSALQKDMDKILKDEIEARTDFEMISDNASDSRLEELRIQQLAVKSEGQAFVAKYARVSCEPTDQNGQPYRDAKGEKVKLTVHEAADTSEVDRRIAHIDSLRQSLSQNTPAGVSPSASPAAPAASRDAPAVRAVAPDLSNAASVLEIGSGS